MYAVVLIDRDSKEQIGEVGEYDTFDEAKLEAEDYNRKGDRHRGHAVVETELPLKRKPARRNPNVNLKPSSGLRLNRKPSQGIPSRSGIPTRTGIPRKVQEHRHIGRNNPSHRPQREEIPRRPHVERMEIPHRTERRQNTSQPKTHTDSDQYVLVWDDILRKPLVLKDSSFTRQMLMAGIGRYDVMMQGEFYEIMAERNRVSKQG